jgi:hypothetical protein
LREVWDFLFRDKRSGFGLTLVQFWGPPLDEMEAAMARPNLADESQARHGYADEGRV